MAIDLRGVFFVECEDLLVAMDSGLRELQSGSTDAETINAVFRAVHSIKGGAGAFALTDLVPSRTGSKPCSTMCAQPGSRPM